MKLSQFIKRNIILLSLFFSSFTNTFFLKAQQINRCSVGDLPSLGNDTSEEFKSDYNNLFRERNFYSERSAEIIVPVAVHVIYKNATEQITVNRIQAIIDIANQDFSRTNPDASQTGIYGYYYSPISSQVQYLSYQNIATSMNIKFCLSAITYDATSIQSFAASTTTNLYNFGTDVQAVKDAYPYYQAFPPSNYLNVWICDISSDIAGYATFPSYSINPKYDGITIDYSTFLPGSLYYRTFTHESGHWFGLYHTFQQWNSGCSDDYVNDIYPIEKSNAESNYNSPYLNFYYGPLVAENNPCYSWNACSNWNVYPQGFYPYVGMSDNYMDYSPSSCCNFFSAGQKSRMDYTLHNERIDLLTTICNPYVGISEIQNDGFAISISDVLTILASNPIQKPLKIELYDLLGKINYSGIMTENTMTIPKNYFPNGIYLLKIGDQFVYKTIILN